MLYQIYNVLPPSLRSFLRLVRALFVFKFPRFVALTHLRIKSSNPKTLNDHILFNMAHNKNSLLPLMSDKFLMRSFVSTIVGKEYLTSIYYEGKKARLDNWGTLPREFVAKVSHGSGGVIVVSENAPIQNKLPEKTKGLGWQRFFIHPDSFNREAATNLINYWLKLDYSYHPGKFPEWWYENANPTFFIEELIKNGNSIVSDIKFFVINHEVKFIRIDTPINGFEKSMVHLDRQWNVLDVDFSDKRKRFTRSMQVTPRPENLQEVLEKVERLSQVDFFVRIDTFMLGSRLLIGEFTFAPTGGEGTYHPTNFDSEMGLIWTSARSTVPRSDQILP